MTKTRFEPFFEADADRPGLVVALDGKPDDQAFLECVVEQGLEDEWLIYDDRAQHLLGRDSDECEVEYRAFITEIAQPPAWRWYIWRPNEDYEAGYSDEPESYLEKANATDEGAFLAAEVVLS